MREWMRRIAWIASRVFIFGSFGIWIFWAVQGMVASAQKPAEQPDCQWTTNADGSFHNNKPCRIGPSATIPPENRVMFYADMPAWIEQHCVAVPECDHGSAEARCGLSGSLKLRCTPDKEPK